MHRVITASLIAVLAFASPATTVAAETTVKLEGCEYSLLLPGAPKIRPGRVIPSPSDAKQTTLIAELRQTFPTFRVECGAMGRLPPGAARFAREDTIRLLQSMNLADIHHSTNETRLGTAITFTGSLEDAGLQFIVSGVVYLGDSSMLNIIATEAAQSYPSEVVTRVLKSVER
ncbi:MAG: hypothetical protein HOI95_24115 [Chromatiales bacterium]|jgi:hypothetical protein|nr:hypothetical protein [Chromatiales bacterium]